MGAVSTAFAIVLLDEPAFCTFMICSIKDARIHSYPSPSSLPKPSKSRSVRSHVHAPAAIFLRQKPPAVCRPVQLDESSSSSQPSIPDPVASGSGSTSGSSSSSTSSKPKKPARELTPICQELAGIAEPPDAKQAFDASLTLALLQVGARICLIGCGFSRCVLSP